MGTAVKKSSDHLTKTGEKRYPVYLIVADKTDEFESALHFAAKEAVFNKARLAVLYVRRNAEIFMPWKQVSDDIECRHRIAAETFLEDISAKLNDYDLTPALYLRAGRSAQVICDLLDEDPTITKLILAADTRSRSPGPLVSYFTGRGLSEINVPVTIVPGHLSIDDYKHFFEQVD